MLTACPACGAGGDARVLNDLPPLPVQFGATFASTDEALATPLHILRIAMCPACGHLWNIAFDPDVLVYDARYDYSLHFSPTFQTYAETLAADLVNTFQLRGKTVVDVGCGKGEFLQLLCRAGAARGIGYDVSYDGPDQVGAVTLVRDFLSQETTPSRMDFVSCRHVLEHVTEPLGLIRQLQGSPHSGNVPAYFEVPNAAFVLSETGPWDFIYPHVSYFTRRSLRALFERAGCQVLSLAPTFHRQYLAAQVLLGGRHGRTTRLDTGASPAVRADYVNRINRQLEQVGRWRTRVADATRHGERAAVWGAGAKGVSFLNLVDPQRRIQKVIDRNPGKWGGHLPGTGHQVLSPRTVATQGLDVVLVANPAYEREIRAELAEQGVDPVILIL